MSLSAAPPPIPESDAPCILAVDDDPGNLQLLRQLLREDYRMLFAKDGLRAIELAQRERPDLILLDVMMPGMTGFEVCRKLKQDERSAAIPVIFVSALADSGAEADGFEAGGADFIAKPVSEAVLRARVSAQLALARAAATARHQTGADARLLRSLNLALRYRDESAALHGARVGAYARVLARAAGMDEARTDELAQAMALHDLGMLGVADAILAKPGPLEEAEIALVRRHPGIGAEILGAAMALGGVPGTGTVAREVTLTHHERWDGNGYPAGLAGTDIPLSGRIAALADVFAALTRAQPWRPAWPLEQALSHLHAESGRHFDPALVRLFLEHLPGIIAVMEQDRAQP
jgi:putative two-component system response regulator